MAPTVAALTPAEELEARAEGQTLPMDAIVASVVELDPDHADGAKTSA
jgi:hypothetical protein